jgi:hypothetical protein
VTARLSEQTLLDWLHQLSSSTPRSVLLPVTGYEHHQEIAQKVAAVWLDLQGRVLAGADDGLLRRPAPVDVQSGAGHVARRVAGEVERRASDLVQLSPTLQRGARDYRLRPFGLR